jgi:hypothetical protein
MPRIASPTVPLIAQPQFDAPRIPRFIRAPADAAAHDPAAQPKHAGIKKAGHFNARLFHSQVHTLRLLTARSFFNARETAFRHFFKNGALRLDIQFIA